MYFCLLGNHVTPPVPLISTAGTYALLYTNYLFPCEVRSLTMMFAF